MPDVSGDYRDIPVLINNFNRCRDLLRLVDWLRRAGQRNVVVLDNASSWPALVAVYEQFERDGIRVERLGRNAGCRAPWVLDLWRKLGVDGPFVYTDSDIVPDEDCPLDLVGHLRDVLAANPDFVKIGLGLRIDDLPDCYARKQQVATWEAQFWRHPVGPGLFLAPTDTTFAIYPQGREFELGPALRTGRPYRGRHFGWYSDSANPTDEERHFRTAADPAYTNWSGGELPELLVGAIDHERRTRPTLLNLRCGNDPLPGWVNVDDAPGPGVDVAFDLARGGGRLPLDDDTVDGFRLRGDGRRLDGLDAALAELHRVARPGAKLLFRGPDEGGVAYGFSRAAQGCAGDWDIARRALVQPNSGGPGETIIELRAVKPAREPRAAPPADPGPAVLHTPVDWASTFP